jgi:hypothetical protein
MSNFPLPFHADVEAVALDRPGSGQQLPPAVEHLDADLAEVGLRIDADVGAPELQRPGHDLAAVDCEVDGKAFRDLERYNIESPLSSLGPLPENNLIVYLYGADWNAENGGTVGVISPSVTTGYHVMLAPLPVGPHTIHFGGTMSIPEIDYLFYLDITYHLTVVPAK